MIASQIRIWVREGRRVERREDLGVLFRRRVNFARCRITGRVLFHDNAMLQGVALSLRHE